jgi:general transcription factor 3C polypeptide 4
LHLLRPCFLYLADHHEVYPQVIRFLQCSLAIKLNVALGNASCSPDVATMRYEFRKSLKRFLFGWDLLLQLRLKLAIADFLLRVSAHDCLPALNLSPLIFVLQGMTDGAARDQCEQIACHLFRVISQIVLRILIRHLMPVAMTLTCKLRTFGSMSQ